MRCAARERYVSQLWWLYSVGDRSWRVPLCTTWNSELHKLLKSLAAVNVFCRMDTGYVCARLEDDYSKKHKKSVQARAT
jgi:hypothetical protein